tara:strand:- start:2053 stop:2745 length:693 start_codon:yes stop_codon:yes gene_type:complete
MRERCTQVIEFVLGIPQYSRGVVGVADVATEVALADTATRTRNGRRIKAVEDLVGELGNHIVGLYEEFLPNDTILPLRLTDSREILEVTRESLRARDERNPEEGPMDYDYSAIPYSPTENHSLIQLQKLQQYLPLLLESPQVDREKLVLKLLELLQMTDIMQDAPPQPEMPMGMPPQEQMMPPAPGGDTLVTGALPPGTQEQPLPPLPAGGPGAPAPAMPPVVKGMLGDN